MHANCASIPDQSGRDINENVGHLSTKFLSLNLKLRIELIGAEGLLAHILLFRSAFLLDLLCEIDFDQGLIRNVFLIGEDL